MNQTSQTKTQKEGALCITGIDELQQLAKKFRDSEEFQRMLDFVAKFNYLAPYNAYLVQLQRPGSYLVLTIKQWEQWGWRPTVNAQNIITLVPFGPIQCLYEVSDVEQIPNRPCAPKDYILEHLRRGLNNARGEVNAKEWDNLMFNLSQYGVRLDLQFDAANSFGGYIMPDDGDHDLRVVLNVDGDATIVKSAFFISVNVKQSRASQFHTICHELGHLFCRHLSYSFKRRRFPLSKQQEEFEAETVAWLVCKRHGVSNPSEEYLAGYIEDGLVPECSPDNIMRAVTEIEKMLKKPLMAKQTIRYKEDNGFKEQVDQLLQEFKKNRKLS